MRVILYMHAESFSYTMGDHPNIVGAIACLGLNDVMSLLQQGRVDVGFIGGAEIDPHGNLNTTRTSSSGSLIRLPGSGGGGDIASLAGRTVLIMEHEPRRFRERVDYITSPGHFPGRRRGGRATLLTTLRVLDLTGGRLQAVTSHPGVTPEQVRQAARLVMSIEDRTPATAIP